MRTFALASLLLLPTVAAQGHADLRVDAPSGPLAPDAAVRVGYRLEVDVPEEVTGNVTLQLGGPWGTEGAVVDAWFDPGWWTIPAPAAGHHAFEGGLWLRVSRSAPAFLEGNVTLHVHASNDTGWGSTPIASATTLLPVQADWSAGLSARVQASHVRIPPGGGEALALAELHNEGNADETVAAHVLLAPQGCVAVVEGLPATLAPGARAPAHARLACEPGWSGGQVAVAFTPRLASDPAREGSGVEVMWDVQDTSMPLPHLQPRTYGDDAVRRDAPWGGAVGAAGALLLGAALRGRGRAARRGSP